RHTRFDCDWSSDVCSSDLGLSMSVLLMLTLLLGAKPDRPDLGGRVVNQAGEPLRGATAFIYTAAARVGINPYCPSCYTDCAKSRSEERRVGKERRCGVTQE